MKLALDEEASASAGGDGGKVGISSGVGMMTMAGEVG